MSEADERNKVLTWGGETSYKRIPGITGIADADGTMIDHFALGAYSTWVRAGRCTFLIDASKIRRALAVYHAFSTAVGRTADKIQETGTNGKAVYISTLTIWSTGRWAARICFWQDCMDKSVHTQIISCIIISISYYFRYQYFINVKCDFKIIIFRDILLMFTIMFNMNQRSTMNRKKINALQ